MSKAPGAFRTISEAAIELDLPQHVLRFWETKFAQIKPMKRAGGRRYYRTDDVELLRGIKHLLYDRGYTIKGVQKLLKERGVKFVSAVASGEAIDVQPAAAAPVETNVGGDEQSDILLGEIKSHGTNEGNASVGDDDRALLNEVLLDLLECKRVLEQAR